MGMGMGMGRPGWRSRSSLGDHCGNIETVVGFRGLREIMIVSGLICKVVIFHRPF
jgi:hypothetical protein